MKKFETIKPMYTNRIIKVIQENYRVKTLEIDHFMKDALPGQFLMVWVPGAGERPMSIGNNNPLTISVADVGQVSSKICSLKNGDEISYRGPNGNSFSVPEKAKRILVVGGGYGVVPMYYLAKVAKEGGLGTFAVIGGRSGKDIIYEKHMFAVCDQVFLTTDDGSKGRKGNVMLEVSELVEKKHVDQVYACGPEKMMKAVAELCVKNNVPCQVSLERYMKCGTGICGSCAINDKFVCRDGPVFDAAEVLGLSEFGKTCRDASGVAKMI